MSEGAGVSTYLYPRPRVQRRLGSKVARIEAALLEEVEALREREELVAALKQGSSGS